MQQALARKRERIRRRPGEVIRFLVQKNQRIQLDDAVRAVYGCRLQRYRRLALSNAAYLRRTGVLVYYDRRRNSLFHVHDYDPASD